MIPAAVAKAISAKGCNCFAISALASRARLTLHASFLRNVENWRDGLMDIVRELSLLRVPVADGMFSLSSFNEAAACRDLPVVERVKN